VRDEVLSEPSPPQPRPGEKKERQIESHPQARPAELPEPRPARPAALPSAPSARAPDRRRSESVPPRPSVRESAKFTPPPAGIVVTPHLYQRAEPVSPDFPPSKPESPPEGDSPKAAAAPDSPRSTASAPPSASAPPPPSATGARQKEPSTKVGSKSRFSSGVWPDKPV
jgi:hypothetical protein